MSTAVYTAVQYNTVEHSTAQSGMLQAMHVYTRSQAAALLFRRKRTCEHNGMLARQ